MKLKASLKATIGILAACLAGYGFPAHSHMPPPRNPGEQIRTAKRSCAARLGEDESPRAAIFDHMLRSNGRLPQSSTITILALVTYYFKHPIPLSEFAEPVTDDEVTEAGRRLTLAHIAKGIPVGMEGVAAPTHFRLLSVQHVKKFIEDFFGVLPRAAMDFLGAIDPNGPLKKFRALSLKERPNHLEEISQAVLEYLGLPENQAPDSRLQRILRRLDEALNSPEMARLNKSWQATLQWYEQSKAGGNNPPPSIVSRPVYVMTLESIVEKYLGQERDLTPNEITRIFLAFR